MSRREDRERAKKARARARMGLVARFLGETPWEIAAALFPLAVDGVHWLLFDPINDRFRELLLRPAEITVVALLGLYLAYVVSLGLIARLKPEIRLKAVSVGTTDGRGRRTTVKTTWPELLFFYPSFGFGIVLVLGAATVSGMLSDEGALSETWQQIAVFGATGIFFAHVIVKFAGIEPRHAASEPRHFAYLVPTVLVSELMLNFSSALWFRFLGPEAGAPAPENPDIFFSFVVAAPLFLVFFAAPRFTFMSKNFTWLSLASGLALALHELWQMVLYAPLV